VPQTRLDRTGRIFLRPNLLLRRRIAALGLLALLLLNRLPLGRSHRVALGRHGGVLLDGREGEKLVPRELRGDLLILVLSGPCEVRVRLLRRGREVEGVVDFQPRLDRPLYGRGLLRRLCDVRHGWGKLQDVVGPKLLREEGRLVLCRYLRRRLCRLGAVGLGNRLLGGERQDPVVVSHRGPLGGGRVGGEGEHAVVVSHCHCHVRVRLALHRAEDVLVGVQLLVVRARVRQLFLQRHLPLRPLLGLGRRALLFRDSEDVGGDVGVGVELRLRLVLPARCVACRRLADASQLLRRCLRRSEHQRGVVQHRIPHKRLRPPQKLHARVGGVETY